eukprot:TRINITY_DN7376_c0_g1_i1.p1 TRINITY_DN7376_c0_g1~~TRINITY_DN7376_c0_g1_i1.p1  ORF type:complete len:665 (+),score=182.84 TRINITY_DN7376_c0_g1_i1:16-2010(+)
MTIMTTDSEIMDTTDQGGIQLNLKTVSDPPPPPSSSPIKTSNIRESKEEEPTKKKPSKKSKSGPHPPATQKKEDFVSGLFTGNPVIPDVGLSGASKDSLPQESLFSGSLFEGIHPFLIKNLSSQGISKPTAVQTAAIPKIIAGKDVLVKSQTGSGKTLAYALPLLHSLQAKTPPINRDSGLFALVIVPTRELALQTYEVFLKLVHSFARIVPGVLHGGEKRKSEKARLRKGINILVSTPGRLLDHIRKTKTLDMSKVEYLIFDEADRMLDLGYERDVSDILNALKENALEGASRQTVLLSATLTKGIQQLSEVSLKHPVFVDITSSDSSSVLPISEQHFETAVPEALQQTFIVVPAKLRLITLSSFILWKCKSNKKVLIFMATQDMVDYHFTLLEQSLSEERKVNFMKLHGNMDQSERTKVFNDFRDIERGTSSNGLVLLCTDVAARGLDLPKVDWIVQYNPPISTADYVHRIGRTARIGSKGSSLLFVLPSETGFLREVEEQKLASFVELTVDRVLEKVFPSDKRRSLEHAATTLQMKMEEAIARDGKLKEIGSQAYVSFIRSYASYPKEVRHLFCFKDLHLGHIAKSFGLRDAPTRITGIGKGGNWVKKQELRAKNAEIKREERVVKSQRKRIDQRALIMSEFSSGFDDMDEKPPAKKRSKK